jgi:hypothetical protein
MKKFTIPARFVRRIPDPVFPALRNDMFYWSRFRICLLDCPPIPTRASHALIG